MTSIFIQDLMWLGGALILALIALMIPLKTMAMLTKPFTLGSFGIRKIKRWHSKTDTLANLMLWISALFCIAAPFIPYAPLIYAVWLTFTWLCTLSRAVRMGRVRAKTPKLTVIFLITLTYGVGLAAGIGMINGFRLWIDAYTFANMIESMEALNIMLYLSDPMPAGFVMQILLLIWPLANLWGQFKYMRLENTYKGASLTSYVVRSVIVIGLIGLVGSFGDLGLEKIYQKSTEEISEQQHLPLNRKKLDSYKGSPADQTDSSGQPQTDSSQPAVEQPANPAAQPADPAQLPAEQQPVEITEPQTDPAQSAPGQPSEEPVEIYPDPVPADPNAL